MQRVNLRVPAGSPDDVVYGRLFQAAQRSQPVDRYALLMAQLPDTEREAFVILHKPTRIMLYLCEVKNMTADGPVENYLCIVD